MGQQAQQQSGDNGMAPVWIMVFLFVVAFVIWKAGHQHIVSFVFFINIMLGKFINLFINSPQLNQDIFQMQTVDPVSIDWDMLVNYTRNVGNYIRYPIVVILVFLGFFLYRSDITLKFRKVYNMKTLRAQEQFNWPAIMPIVKFDLGNVDINEGPWAMALTPMEFARKNQLLRKDDVLLDNPVPGQEMTAGVRRVDAKRVFTLQLGPYWDGFDRAPPHARALAAVFMARMNRDRSGAINILETIDKTSSAGKPDFTVATATLRKFQNEPKVQEIVNGHAYLLTVLASLLTAARLDGVVPSSEFLWLKPIDRRLWYMLNSIGRQTPYSEVAGPFAHWRAEKVMGRRMLVPIIDEAIKALEIAVKEVKISEKEMQELQP